MSEFSDYMENKVINAMRGIRLNIGVLYAALQTVNPTDVGGGTEVTGNNYGRIVVPISAPSTGASSNPADAAYNTATAGWGTINAYGLFDAQTSGNLIMWTPLTTPKAINTGDTAKFNTGDIDITVD